MAIIAGDIIAQCTCGVLEKSDGDIPDAPVISSVIDGGDQDSVVVTITGSGTIQLYYRERYSSEDWTIGESRSGAGSITQTGLTAGTWYEFYVTATASGMVSAPSNIMTCRVVSDDVSGDVSPTALMKTWITGVAGLMSDPSDSDVWPLYISSMPHSSGSRANAGVVTDTAGSLDGRTMDGDNYQHYGIQLIIRSGVYSEGWDKITEIANALDDLDNAVIVDDEGNNYTLHSVMRTSAAVYLGPEEGASRRFLFSVNFIMVYS